MKNIFIFNPLGLENGRGGEISAIELASGLQEFYNITLMDTNIFIGKKLLSKETINKKLKGLKKTGRIKFVTLSIFNKNFNFPYPWEIIKLFKLIKRNEIIYLSYSDIKQSLIFMFFSLLHRKGKFIIGYRKPLHSDKLFSLYNLKYRISLLFLSFFKRNIYHHALSKNAKKYLENFYNPKKIIHIIHGIKLNKFTSAESKKEPENKLKFVYIGFLDDVHKGVAVLLKAIEIFLEECEKAQVIFEFCGMGPLKSAVKELKQRFPEDLQFNGYIDNEKIARYYNQNDVFLFSSRVEPFPRAIMEALASKLIIISSKTIGSVELLKGRNFAFFIDDLNPRAIKEKISEVYDIWLENPQKIKELQEAARKFVVQNYSMAQEINMFKELIEKISK